MTYGRISKKQQEILDYMKNEILNRGFPPSVREICEAVNLKSTSSVHSHLEALEKNGYIRRDATKPRAIEIIDDTVKGDSMINAGIFDGDQVLVKQQATAENGDMVVALIDDSATVKTFYKENGYYRLQPENDNMEPIIITGNLQILGKVFGVFRFFS